MSTYEDDHNIPPETTTSAPPDPSSPSYARHAPRPAPRTFDEFMREVQRLAMDGAVGEGGVDGGGLMVDEELYEDIFGDEGRKGASKEFIENLKRVHEKDVPQSDDSTCPICLAPYAQILTEEEYALATDHYVGDASELGLRELPCGQGTGGTAAGRAGHVVCGKCITKWLRVSNSCPLCRTTMDPSVAAPTESSASDYSDRMLELFRQVFGYGYGVHGGDAAGARPGTARAGAQAQAQTAGRREEQADPTWGGGSPGREGRGEGIFSVSPGRGGFAAFGLGAGFGGRRRDEDDREEFSGMYS